mmetsp:Transcript_34335/g.94642  ORF Transcript_34335/g.94642 Transcript_34335/m.94642 type:complete len:83 (-) Transcript_34335:141-389(-)
MTTLIGLGAWEMRLSVAGSRSLSTVDQTPRSADMARAIWLTRFLATCMTEPWGPQGSALWSSHAMTRRLQLLPIALVWSCQK